MRNIIAVWRSGFSRRRCKFVRLMYVLWWHEYENALAIGDMKDYEDFE